MEQLKDFRFMVCDNEKRPTHSFDETFSYEDVKDKPNLGVKLKEPFVVFDVDTSEEFEIVLKIIKDLNIKTRILKTSRGGHFWFKSMTPLKNVIKSNTPVTIKVDIKSWGKNTMEFVKKDGVWREWLQFDDVVDEVPYFLKPIVYKKDVLHYKDGDGRDDALFTYIIPLINEGLTKNEIYETFRLINKYVFDEPLTKEEIDKMFDDNKMFDAAAGIFFKGSKFQHNIFADYLIKEHRIRGYGNDVYFYHNNMYTNNRDILISKMIEVIPHLVTQNIKETYENIRLKMIQKNEKTNPDYINLKNGLLNIKTGQFELHNPEIFVLNQLDCVYDKHAYDESVYNVINSLSCGDEDTTTLLIQMLGYFLLGDCRYQKSFILLGGGRNGKSMFLEMIRNWLGDDNCSSLALEDLSKTFRTAELVGKMVNIGDDSGHNLLENTAIFKKLVTGDSITVERKNQNPFKFSNKAKMIFAANSLPPTTDKSEGFFRRCIIIPFNAVYKETDKTYDPNMIEKITTETAKSYLLLLAIKGLQSLYENKMFYVPANSKSINDYYEISNNNVMMWYSTVMNEYDTLQKAFGDYLMYCANNGYKPVSIGRFQQEYEKLKKGFK